MRRSVSWLLATLLSVGIGAGTFLWLVSNVELAGMMALSWAVAIGLALQHDTLMFGSVESRGRRASLWSGGFTGFLTFVAITGSMSLPISEEFGLAVGFLVLGVGFAALQFGIGMALAHREETANTGKDPRAAP